MHGMQGKWIGLAQVKPRPGNKLLDDAAGAFVAAVSLASGLDDYVAKVTTVLSAYGFDVLNIKDIEPCVVRAQKYPLESAVQELSEQVSEEGPVSLGTFHTFTAY
jgi:hypothetical protein